MKKKNKKNISISPFFWILAPLLLITLMYLYNRNLSIKSPSIHYPSLGISIPTGFTIHGIDVSRYQQRIHWRDVRNMNTEGIQIGFAFIKATEGRSLTDPLFRRNWHEAGKQKIIKGAYHFFRPDENALAQVRNFTGIVSLQSGDLPPVLDLETPGSLSVEKMQESVATWLQKAEQFYGVKPIIYSNISFYNHYLAGRFDEYPLWIAHYHHVGQPRIYRNWIFWQHSETGRVNGIKTKVDYNVFHGDSTDLKKWLIP